MSNIKAMSVEDLMSGSIADKPSIPDRLNLAKKAALAVLQFRDTPWLHQEWYLRDFGYFGRQGQYSSEDLNTIHLGIRIARTLPRNDIQIEDVNSTPYIDQDYFGVHNMLLFCLGLALLQLGHWKRLPELKEDRDPNYIVAGRRLASRQTMLGPRYQRIVQKCLQCNFGVGNDLRDNDLQQAVYASVVSELEYMINSLTVLN
jgi:hypothetical protein